ncbi:PDR/VanB family oxidoreductase [Aldersonia sp. NBC_00410]|uniref:PDR/VanB family oxidoreductase n=1 Tax=Aldersonia sp. NBC_00410 TaxID=2975954 RepID=UPI00225AF93C|nr:PDR/VanB family oxidoreductase [Aldersonia sp. NBC_00410]MCX5046355.1 PDR/VanB family oxidoreductase [Aldersonia sp. NBC_00410]
MTTVVDPPTHAQSTADIPSLVASAAADGLVLAVVAKTDLADGVCELTFADPAGRRLPDWAPGAHIDVILPGDLVRQYSLCGDRWDPFHYRIAVLRESDGRGGSAYIHDTLAVGDRLPIGGPRNNFALVPAHRYVFIAGGIGVTPILPMLDHADRLGTPWALTYVGRSARSMAFATELSADPRVTVWPSVERGPFDLATVFADDLTKAKVYSCGPERLLDAVRAAGADLPAGSLRIEHFVPRRLSAPVRDRSFDVELRRSGVTVSVTPETSVLEAVGAAGVPMLSSCRQGTCGTCEATVLDGTPDHRDSLLADDERSRNDCMFLCVSRSCSDRLVLDL